MSEWTSVALWLAAMLATAFVLSGGAMWRTWLCLAGSCAAAWAAHFWFYTATGLPVAGAFIAIDFTSAMFLLAGQRVKVQEAVAWLFLSMMTVNIAFVWAGQSNPSFAGEWNRAAGWVQVALLFGWGLDERYRIIDRLVRIADAVRAYSKAGKP